jgi:hypothetical protein
VRISPPPLNQSEKRFVGRPPRLVAGFGKRPPPRSGTLPAPKPGSRPRRRLLTGGPRLLPGLHRLADRSGPPAGRVRRTARHAPRARLR